MNFLENLFPKTNENQINGLTDQLKVLYTYRTFQTQNKSVLLVTSNIHKATKYYTSLSNHTSKVWFFPMDDFLTSEAIAISPEFKATRLEAINSILKNDKVIIVTNLMGYLRFLPPKQNFIESTITLKTNNDYNHQDLINKLYHLGYTKQTTISMTGEIATRGYVIDIFPINTTDPVRIEFWGETIDTIKTFDINTQRTKNKIDQITIYPNTEFLINKDTFNIPYRDIYKYTSVENISSYLNNPITIFDEYKDIQNNYTLLLDEIHNYALSTNQEPTTKYMHNLEDITQEPYVTLSNFGKTNHPSKEIEPFPKQHNQIIERLKTYLSTNKITIICLENRYQVNTLIETILEIKTIYTNENNLFKNKINIIIKKLTEGFENQNYIVITPKELYRKQEENNYKSNFKYGTKIKDITKLQIGDYVVHGTYGIGKYLGIKTVPKNNIKKDYIMLEYKDNDKLYIPVEKLDYITKYSGKEGATPKLNKLGTKEWQKAKARAQKHAEDIAEELLQLYAKRETTKGYAFPKDTKEQIEFEKQFTHTETIDQLRVTEEIKKDMESPKPMDRLLCGDVGYGKTEVAFRAVFKCIISGKQAAILCPTTILSSQHFQNAIERFKSFPVNIALLNRFTTTKQTNQILQELKQGKIDLLIGTHRILSSDIKFKDLGLLVIDEEQRFGVKHKEKIKQYKNNIDILTLSATPIPRTLQMSVAGIRSMSLIETPPEQRYPIQTYVLPENNQIIKDAIYKELARNGQTYILYNNIENIQTKQSLIQTLIPEAKVAYAHGRMNKNDLENIMIDFSEKKYDILLCTTIIETGIDIPSVNTLIILDSDKFGLSQLYQIRGRIGRSNKIAYCYLMYNNQKILSEIATKRLKVIKDFTELGSGFSVAMRDLSIRGAGSILGSSQSGFIDEVGVELFIEMLNNQINKLQGKQTPKEESKPTPLIEVETYIPDNYIEDEELKIEIHKKINQIDSYEKLNQIKDELEDRFGKLTNELIIYMHEEWFEKLAQKLNITETKQTKNFIQITLPPDLTNKIDGQNLFYDLTNLSRMFRLSLKNNKITITLDTIKLDKHFIYYLIDMLQIVQKNIKSTN